MFYLNTEIVKVHLNEAIREIQSLISNTEDIYGAIYTQLPRLEQEIDLTLDETSILLEYCIPGAASTHDNGNRKEDMLKLSLILRRVEQNFTVNSQELVNEHDMLHSVRQFLGNQNGEKTGITALLEIMGKVKERLTDIEIISMNAIIHAAHLGESGQAFGVISDQINTLSNELAEHYLHLETIAEDLKGWNEHFIEGLQEMISCHNDLISRQRDDLKQLIDLTFDSLANISSLLRNLMNNVKNAVQPVQGVMVSIQAQDIIRQSMENMNKCLELIVDSINKHTPEQTADNFANLELLNFVAMALDFVQKMTSNIETELTGSLANLDEQLTDMRLRMMELEEDGTLLANFLGGNPQDENGNNSVGSIFLQAKDFIHNYSLGLNTLQKKIDNFSYTNSLFYTHITGLEDKINTIRGRIGFLQKLGLLVRIELARIDEQKGSFVREISNITDRVVKDVNMNEELIISLKKKLHQELYHFDRMLGENREKAVSMLEISRDATEELEQIENLISGAIQTLGQNCINLMEVVDKARTHLEEGSRLPAKLHEIKSVLNRLNSDVNLFQHECLESAGLEKWEGTSLELEKMLGNLTTYMERFTANDVISDVVTNHFNWH